MPGFEARLERDWTRRRGGAEQHAEKKKQERKQTRKKERTEEAEIAESGRSEQRWEPRREGYEYR